VDNDKWTSRIDELKQAVAKKELLLEEAAERKAGIREVSMDLKTELGAMQQHADFVRDKLTHTETELAETKSRLEEVEIVHLKLVRAVAELNETKSKLKAAETMRDELIQTTPELKETKSRLKEAHTSYGITRLEQRWNWERQS
jgi:ABC-type transporter Mla subunit MlaD